MISKQALFELLETVRAADPGFVVYGSNLHRYRFGPPLDEDLLEAFEQQIGIRLPQDYRNFVREVGDGGGEPRFERAIGARNGPGPGCGLFPLYETLGDCAPSKPFPLTEETRTTPIPDISGWADDVPVPGVLNIGYGGGGLMSYLVVNGPAYGSVWEVDYVMATNEAVPVGKTFDQWYSAWVESLRRSLPRLVHEVKVHKVTVGMTLQEVLGLIDEPWVVKDDSLGRRCLTLRNVLAHFLLDAEDRVLRVIRYGL